MKFIRAFIFMMAAHSSDSRGMELFITYYDNPSVNLRNQIVKLNTGLVKKIANRVSQQCPEPYEDLVQMGYLGLIRAIERYNPHQGAAFSSFAVPFIRGEMLHFLRDKGNVVKIPRRWQELQQEGQRISKKLHVTLGRMPKDPEIAEALKISLEEWQNSKAATQNRSPLSLDASVSQLVDNPLTLADMIPDTYDQTLRNLEEERQELQGAMSQLEEKTQAALELVFFWDMPRKEAAKRIGVSPMTVTRHIQRGINQLLFVLQTQTVAGAGG